ncbi:aldehyde reductase [Eremomyces bilateralis CBS 781.70]|uniref:Aldehyde reductase n=1 Tax=Eremomyces bilateralis CBS 781.70 TaxID=1392243 RepID=A0A6G1GGR5_9PEZI|nr:aldehyde reductase [Eremomyces bilateralis CBS 781.70]KAF1817204.1 aldehyde reductase [Eremomyces bilateralis CBS 781.70]
MPELSFTPVLPKGSLVLVSGANSMLGSHVVKQLLEYGYKVRGTVRDVEKNAWMVDFFKSYGEESFELVRVLDIAVAGAFDDAIQGCAGVIHLAMVTNWAPNHPDDVVPLAVAATLGFLKSAADTPSVKRFVHCSSSAAARRPTANVRRVIDSDTYNDETVQAIYADKGEIQGLDKAFAVYTASKVQSEKAAWKFVEENKPPFVFNTVLPELCFGEIFNAEKQGFPSSAGFAKACFEGDLNSFAFLPPQQYVNTEDAAVTHIAGLIHPDVTSERLFAFAEPFNWNDVLAVYRKLFPSNKFLDDMDLGKDLLEIKGHDRVDRLLKEMGRPKGFRKLEESLTQLTKAFA